MDGADVGGAAIGAAFGSVLEIVKVVAITTYLFKSKLELIEKTLISIAPKIDSIAKSNFYLKRPGDTKMFIDQLKAGEKLVRKCSIIKPWELRRKFKYSMKLSNFQNQLLWFFQVDVQALLASNSIKMLARQDDLSDKMDLALSILTKGNGGGYCNVPGLPDFIVGLDEPLKELKWMVLQNGVSIVVLSAPGGSGKTTLSKMLCKDEEIQVKNKPELVKSHWIESSKDFFLRHFGDITAPAMLWTYGLGPRPADTLLNVLLLEDLPNLAVLLRSERNDPGLMASGAAKELGAERNEPPTELDDEQMLTELLEGRPMNVVPLQQVRVEPIQQAPVASSQQVPTVPVQQAPMIPKQRVPVASAQQGYTTTHKRLVIKPNVEKALKKRSALPRGLPPSKRSKVHEVVKDTPPSPPPSSLPVTAPTQASLLHSRDNLTWRDLMNAPIEDLHLLSPEETNLEKKETLKVTESEQEVVITGAKEAPEHQPSPQGPEGRPSDSSSPSGASPFVQGFTLPPLSQAILDKMREQGTTSMGSSFSVHMSQAIKLFFSALHLAEEGSSSAGYSALQEELIKTQQELHLARSDLERAEEDRKNLSAQVASVLSEAEDMKGRMKEFGFIYQAISQELEDQKKESFSFKSELAMCRKDLVAAGVVLEGAQKVTEQELKAREDAEASLKLKELKLVESKQRQEALQKELDEIKRSFPVVKAQAVEEFCSSEGPLLRISDSFTLGFYTCKETALQNPDDLATLEVPSELEVTPELEAKIAEKQGDALAVLQLIRAEEPDILTKWETGEPSPQKDGQDGDDGEEQ